MEAPHQPPLLTPEEFERLRTNGIKVNYWAVCPRKLWLFAKGMRMEGASDRVLLGRLLHESVYPSLPRREVMLDELVRVDVLEGQGRVLEVKYSRRLVHAARLQVAYYLLYLRHLGAGDLTGELRFPKERRREEVHLTSDLEEEVALALRDIARIEAMPSPPNMDYMPICRTCAYAELCWG
jgi:CRISPR-associated exonuclease Cas4